LYLGIELAVCAAAIVLASLIRYVLAISSQGVLRRWVAATAVTVLLVVSLTATSAASSRVGADDRVRLGSCGSTYTGSVKPRRWDLGCTGVWDIFAARWRRWGRPVASAKAKTMVATCDPDCVSGPVFRYNARVKVWRIRSCADGDGNVRRFYTRLRLRYRVPEGDPFPAGVQRRTMPIQCLNG
jgi:hypothetical protein